VKGAEKKVRVALESKSLEEAQAALQEAIPIIDKAASKGALHHRTAARKIARLSKRVYALSAEQK
jgi:small subunit ribosomal protein S20